MIIIFIMTILGAAAYLSLEPGSAFHLAAGRMMGGTLVIILLLMLMSLPGMIQGPTYRARRPPTHPPGWENRQRSKKSKERSGSRNTFGKRKR